MVTIRHRHTGAAIYNPDKAPLDTPKARGQENKKPREPRHEGPALAPAVAARALRAVLADLAGRRAAGYQPDPATGYTDVTAQTLDILDALGLKIPGYVTTVEPGQGAPTHVPREQWDAWQTEIYQARLRDKMRRSMQNGEIPAEQDMIILARTDREDRRLRSESIRVWIERLRSGAETWEEEDE